MTEQLSSETWRATLERQAPWWNEMAKAALTRLDTVVPERHFGKEVTESRLSWSSSDPIASALGFLDDLLAIDPVPPFDALQLRLVQTVAAKWRGWPPFTKALTLSSLRVWFWHHFPALRMLLAEIIRAESNPSVVRYAVDLLVEIMSAEPAPELPDFVKRAASGGHGDALRQVAKVLGTAAVAASFPSAGRQVKELTEFFRQTLAFSWPDPEALSDFLEGVLIGATDCALQEEYSSAVEDSWLPIVESVVALWPFDKLKMDQRERFPLQVLWAVIDSQESPDDRARLLHGLAQTLETILRKADIAAFCTLHFLLTGLVAGRHQRVPGKHEREWREGICVTESVENTLRNLCRAAVDRVVAWKHEGRTTDDLGWQAGLDGRDTANLVKACMVASRDPAGIKRELMPLADMLGNAGLTNVAADLHVYLRRS